MPDARRLGTADLVLLLLILLAAAGTRAWYVSFCATMRPHEVPIRVQDDWPILSRFPLSAERPGQVPPNELDALVKNLKESNWFGSLAPLATAEEQTAHVSPGYPWLLALLERAPAPVGHVGNSVRWIQCGLGTLTAAIYFLFAFRAFASRLVATLTGLFCAFYPFWIINTAEVNDGVLATFLLAACLALGARGAQSGGAVTSVLFGLGLAGLALVRAALLPFAIVAVLWFLLRCRSLHRGWLSAVLAFVGFMGGLEPWLYRNFKVFGNITPIVNSTYLHLWVGNNPLADGGPQNEETILATLAKARDEDPKQTAEVMGRLRPIERERELGREVWLQVQSDPAGVFKHRLEAAVSFFLGHQWLKDRTVWRGSGRETADLPAWFVDSVPQLSGSLFVLFGLALFGWRWAYGWRPSDMLASLAVVWIPLPYILGHSEALSGPRLPLDGILLCYAAFALACFVPTVGGVLLRGVRPKVEAEESR